MGNLSADEFEASITLLAEGGTPERLRDRLVRLNAFHSRRGLNSIRSIADRLFTLSSGLRRDVPATRAFQALWTEHIAKGLTQSSGSALDELAERINATLQPDGSLREGQEEELDKALAEYEDLMARKVGGKGARLDMLQKAVPLVAAKLRAKPELDVPLDPPEEEEAEHDHSGHAHAHGHDHAHAHDHEAPPAAGKTARADRKDGHE